MNYYKEYRRIIYKRNIYAAHGSLLRRLQKTTQKYISLSTI